MQARQFFQEWPGEQVVGFHRNDDAVVLSEPPAHVVVGQQRRVVGVHEGFDPPVGLQLRQRCRARADNEKHRNQALQRMVEHNPCGGWKGVFHFSGKLADEPRHADLQA